MKKSNGMVFPLLLLLITAFPLSSFAEEQQLERRNPPGPQGGPGFGPGPGGHHRQGPHQPRGDEQGFENAEASQAPMPLDANNDGQIGPRERRQAMRRERFGEKAMNSTGESSGKPAWMDNNPLKPAGEGGESQGGPGAGPGWTDQPGVRDNPPGMRGGPGTDWNQQGQGRGPQHRPQGGGNMNPPGPRGGPGFGNVPGPAGGPGAGGPGSGGPRPDFGRKPQS